MHGGKSTGPRTPEGKGTQPDGELEARPTVTCLHRGAQRGEPDDPVVAAGAGRIVSTTKHGDRELSPAGAAPAINKAAEGVFSLGVERARTQ